MKAVKEAETRYLAIEDSKAYIAQIGVPEFNAGILELMFGANHVALKDERVRTVMTPGGCGALRVGAEFLKQCSPEATIWVSDPTWANHIPLLGSAGLRLQSYPYYDKSNSSLRFDDMLAGLAGAGKNDVVLVHGCCHNPCGADLDEDQWQQLGDLAEKNGFLPFIDMAYQGFGQGVEEDPYGVRYLAERLPEILVASSCSKNFGLYRERTGSLTVVAHNAEKAQAGQTHIASTARSNYSMSPAHGGALAGMVLQDPDLKAMWLEELAEMRNRINDLRVMLVNKLAEAGAPKDFSFIQRESGMFSFLGISPNEVKRLQVDFGVYIVGSSRINVAGISASNVDYLAESITSVLKGD